MKFSRTLLSSLSVLAIAAVLFWWWSRPPAINEGCLVVQEQYAVCAASNMSRASQEQSIALEHEDFDISDHEFAMVAARNESIAFQLILRTLSKHAPETVQIRIGDWRNGAGDSVPDIKTELFSAHYHWVEKGGYQWGPKSAMLEWPAAYPDALIPQRKQCLSQKKDLFETVTLPEKPHHNQALWFDSYIPDTVPAGQYRLPVQLETQTDSLELTLNLDIHNAVLPDKPTVTALGELYRSYRTEGVGEVRDTAQWREMSYCYQQLAHQHRVVFIERTPVVPEDEAWEEYITTLAPVLSGELFSDSYEYTGPGKNTPPTVWRTPWPQEFDVELKRPLTEADFLRYSRYAFNWAEAVASNNWDQTKFFAYIFDEIDGPSYDKVEDREYLAMAHLQMGMLQSALDEGSPEIPIDLLWTSHSNPAQWTDDAELDLRNKIRLWSPNASAADPEFLGQQIESGDTAWFYHSGHPAVGTHSINSSGFEMRTWGLIAARYGLQGQFMWAVNLGSDERPFAEPSYKPDDDRFGNGVLVYPGNQLDKIGFPVSPGPVPSMRLKAWRRGLQDAELYFLASKNSPDEARSLLYELIPQALADGKDEAAWPREPAAWIDFKKKLLSIAAK